MTSITANLSPAQCRLLNVLHDTGASAPGMSARKAKQAADIDHADVIGLALAGLVEARRQPRGDLVDIPSATSTLLYVGGTTLRQTNLGISWVRENPRNALLRALDEFARGRFILTEAKKVHNDRGVIVSLVSYGFARLHYAGDLRETKFSEDDGAYEFRHPGDFALIATSKIRTVLGPVTGS